MGLQDLTGYGVLLYHWLNGIDPSDFFSCGIHFGFHKGCVLFVISVGVFAVLTPYTVAKHSALESTGEALTIFFLTFGLTTIAPSIVMHSQNFFIFTVRNSKFRFKCWGVLLDSILDHKRSDLLMLRGVVAAAAVAGWLAMEFQVETRTVEL